MAASHHQRNEHELGQTLGDGEGQGVLQCGNLGLHRVGHDWVTEQQQEICKTASLRLLAQKPLRMDGYIFSPYHLCANTHIKITYFTLLEFDSLQGTLKCNFFFFFFFFFCLISQSYCPVTDNSIPFYMKAPGNLVYVYPFSKETWIHNSY